MIETLADHYHWQLSMLTAFATLAVTLIGGWVMRLVPTIGAAAAVNTDTFNDKMQKPAYAANQAWNRKWAAGFLVVVYLGILPFCLTIDTQPWWHLPRDCFVILMVYDFVYYLTHRFTFHENGWFGGPLKWMHAIHHRQHNPCKADSSYIHPLEVAIGLGLFVCTIFVLSRFMGPFHMVTVVISFIAFSNINLHNHARWSEAGFPFKYLAYASEMHHYHHAKFTGGNYATITLFYDWLFGTLDDGKGWGKHRKV